MTKRDDNNPEDIPAKAVQRFVNEQLQGREPDIESFVKEYPGHESQIRQRLRQLHKINNLFSSLTQAEEDDFAGTVTVQDLEGQKIGDFEIVQIIGHGGMGVVYLAKDTNLERSVAVKSIPVELLGNTTALSRFRREAKLLASLSHPNIAVIHDMIESDDDSVYLILEYIPGETLAERIARGPLKLQEALTIGLQVAEAVITVHKQGIIHRDLKPQNIKFTSEGQIKVLDFGLARTSTASDKSKDVTVTQPGRVIGTPAYMSPEQARGESIDHRTDVWAFGCVMYEMLTGQLPFKGNTATDVVARILERDPDWERLPAATPANIRVLIRRCLEKNPSERLQHIGDALIEIRETLNVPAVEPPSVAPASTARAGIRRHVVTASLLCLLLVSVVVCLVLWKRGPGDASPGGPVRSYVIHPQTSLGMEALWHHVLAFSPDGTRLAYVEQGNDRRRRIYVRRMDEVVAKPLAGTDGAISPFFSPDGKWIGYVDHFHRQLKKVSSKGGNPMVLTPCLRFRGGAWAEDGTIIFCPNLAGGLWRISASGEGLKQLTFPDVTKDERGHRWPSILPDGKTVLFTSTHTAGLDEYRIEIYSMETGECRELFRGAHYARYVSTGHLVYARRENLYAVGFDLGRLETTGNHVQIKSDVMSGNSRSSQFTCSDDGSLAYIPVVIKSTELKPVWVDNEGTTQLLDITPRNYHSVRISPDGARIAFTIKEGDNQDIWISDLSLAHPTLSPLTSNGKNRWPVWLVDSKRIVFSSQGQLLWQHADGSTQPRLIASRNTGGALCCSPDGKELLVSMHDPNDQTRNVYLGVLTLENPESNSPAPFIRRDHNPRHAVWEISVEPYPGPGPRTTISTQGGIQPVWARDGKELYYRSGDKIMAVSLDTESELKVLDSKVLFEGNYLNCFNCQTYDVAPDGRFLMIQDPLEPAPARIIVILNWTEQLKRLIPKTKRQ
jgi:serine/threonine-protein kinase